MVEASNKAGVKIIARLDFQPPGRAGTARATARPTTTRTSADFVSAFAARYRTGSPSARRRHRGLERGQHRSRVGQAADQPHAGGRLRPAAERRYRAATRPTRRSCRHRWALADGRQDQPRPTTTSTTCSGCSTPAEGRRQLRRAGAHGNAQAPEVEVALNSLPAFGHPSFYFRRIEQLREVQVERRCQSQIWLLEFGWTADRSTRTTPGSPSAKRRRRTTSSRPSSTPAELGAWIGVMTLWKLPDPLGPDREEYWWAIANPDGPARRAHRDRERPLTV